MCWKETVVSVVILVVSASATAAGNSLNAKDLDTIYETADRICGEFLQEGSRSQTSISGAVEAHLSGLSRLLGKAGADGSYEAQTIKWQNVAQEYAHKEFKDNRQCRMYVWNDLKEILNISPPIGNNNQNNIDINGNCNYIITNNSGSVSSNCSN